MANQPSGPPAQTTGSTYRTVVFFIAFIFLWLESVILVTSTAWEGYAPCWANPILDKSGPLLGVAAAVMLLLSLLWAWNPTGLAKYATLSSGVLGYAAATHSLELGPDDLPLGLVLLALTLPFFMIMLPRLRRLESMADLVTLSPAVLFLAVSAMSVMLGIAPITKAVITVGVHGTRDLLITSVIMAMAFTAGIIVVQLVVQGAVELVGGWAWPRGLRFRICRRWPRRRMTRMERRRAQRRRR